MQNHYRRKSKKVSFLFKLEFVTLTLYQANSKTLQTKTKILGNLSSKHSQGTE